LVADKKHRHPQHSHKKESIMRRTSIDKSKHHAYQFIGCEHCGAQCCASHIIFLTFFDYASVSEHFPIFFYIKEKHISLVYFFHNGHAGQKCHYLDDQHACSIYAQRPYACQAYPFEYQSKQQITADFEHCPGLVKKTTSTFKGIPLIQQGKVNPYITNAFLGHDFVKDVARIREETDAFVRFCLTHQLLTPYQSSNLAQQYPDFASQHLGDLYMIHQQKAAVLGLKYAKSHPEHYDRIRQHLRSLHHIARISQTNHHTP
jgi:Fe-S-cluster containining protein